MCVYVVYCNISDSDFEVFDAHAKSHARRVTGKKQNPLYESSSI